MRINPPEAAALATIYRIWAKTLHTDAWVCLGAALSAMATRLGGWPQVHQFCTDHLATIPMQHLKTAFADHLLRTNGNPFAN
jgi:hypothetical protein